MGKVKVAVTIDAPPREVWEEVRHIDRHVDWMADAVEIRFTSGRHEGEGTTFDCDTKVGPIRLTDRMEITEWREGKAMGVRHVGVVTGEGRFSLKRARKGRTRFTWEERLTYPVWLGGRIGGLVGDRIMRRIWKKNLTGLARIIERPGR